MSYHIVSIDSAECKVSVYKGQLVVSGGGVTNSVPLEDVASIVITSFKCDLSMSFLVQAAKCRIGVVLCELYSPVSVLLPVDRATDTELIRNLSSLTPQCKRRLWKKTIDAKCHNQFVLACKWDKDSNLLPTMENISLSEKDSKESECAKLYWSIFSVRYTAGTFRRDKSSDDYNALFNYAYAVLLSCVLRNLLALGIDPTFGIFHTTRAHSAPLAYDLMEPFRPVFDEKIASWIQKIRNEGKDLGKDYISTEYRHYIVSTLTECYSFAGSSLSLNRIIENVIRSFRTAVLVGQTGIYEPWKI